MSGKGQNLNDAIELADARLAEIRSAGKDLRVLLRQADERIAAINTADQRFIARIEQLRQEVITARHELMHMVGLAQEQINQHVALVISHTITSRVDATVEILMDEAREEIQSTVLRASQDVQECVKRSQGLAPPEQLAEILRTMAIPTLPAPKTKLPAIFAGQVPIKMCTRVDQVQGEPLTPADKVPCDVCGSMCWSDRHTPYPVRIVCGRCLDSAETAARKKMKP